MAVSLSTQARLGFAAMVLLAGVAILTPTLIKISSGELDSEEVERPGPPLYAIHAILRADPGVRACAAAWSARSGRDPQPFTLDFELSPQGRAAVHAVTDIEGAPALQSCLEGAIAQVSLPPFEGPTQSYSAAFAP